MPTQYDPHLGYMPAIPEPFYSQSWFGFNKRYHCMDCGQKFKTRSEYSCHWVLNHVPEGDC